MYLPKTAFGAMFYLYSKMLNEGKSKAISSLQEMLAIIKDGVEKFLTSSNDEIKFSSDIDKELVSCVLG